MFLIFPIYFVALILITIIAIGIQSLTLYLIYKCSPKNMTRYRPYLMLSTVYDIIYTFVIGVLLQGSPSGSESDPTIVFSGLLVWLFKVDGARVALVLFYSSFALVAIGQTMCLLYRYLVFHNRRQKVFHFIFGGRGRIRFIHFLIYVSVIALSIFAVTRLDLGIEETEYGFVGVYLDNKNKKTDTVKFIIICVVLLALWELSYIGIFVRIMQLLRPKLTTFSPNTIRLHRQLSYLLLAQAISPLICMVVPVILAALDRLFVDTHFGYSRIKASFLMSSIQMALNSMLTIAFVAPFRLRTKKLIYKLFICLRIRSKGADQTVAPVMSLSNSSTVSQVI